MKRNNFSKMVLTLFASLALVITGTSTVNNKTQQVVKATTIEESVATFTYPDEKKESVNSYTDTWNAKIGSIEWTITNANNNAGKWTFIKFGSKKNTSVGKISTSSLTAKKVSKIVLTIDAITASNVNSIYLNVKENDTVDKIDLTTSPAKGENEFTISNSALNKDYELVFDCLKGSANGFIQVSKVEYFAITETSMTALSVPTALIDGADVLISPVDNASSYEIGLFTSSDDKNPIKTMSVTNAEDIYTIDFKPQGEFFVKVRAIGDGENYLSSDWSESIGTYVQNTIEEKTVTELLSLEPETAEPYTYYQVTGTVSKINDSSKGDFDLCDLNDSSKIVKVYGLAENKGGSNAFSKLNITVGDKITLIGYYGKYNTTLELMDSYLVNVQKDYTKTFTSELTKSQLKLAYSQKGTLKESSGEATTTLSTFNFTNKSTNMEYDVTNAVGLDNTIFKATYFTNNNSNAYIQSEIRLYPGATNGSAIKIECLNGTMSSVNVTFATKGTNTFTDNNGNVIEPNNNVYESSTGFSSFTIQNTVDATSGNQVKISKIVITYSGMATTYTYDIESTSLRFGTTISKDLYDGLVAEGTNVTFGVISQATSVLGENELTVENAGNTKELTPVRVDTELASEESETGNYYQFAVLFTGLTAADYTTEVTARCYVCIDGTYYYMQAKTCSVKSIAADYLSLQADNEQVVANSGVLNYLANYTAE